MDREESLRRKLLRRRSTRTGLEVPRARFGEDAGTLPEDEEHKYDDDFKNLAFSPLEERLSDRAFDRFHQSDDNTQRSSVIKLCVVAVFASAVTWAFSAVWRHHLPRSPMDNCSIEKVRQFLPGNATIENVTAVAKGGSFGEGAANLWAPVDATDLPALCTVTVRVPSSPTSAYRVGLFLPAVWSGRLLATGGGGFGGGIGWVFMADGARRGFVAVATDTGHNSTSTDLDWALGRPEARADWGWRSLHSSVATARAVAAGFYGEPVQRAYYSGCSTGGRQGLRELQMAPDTFDGVLVGAPAWYTTRLNTYVAAAGRINPLRGEPGHVPPALFPIIGREVVRQCDGADGVVDGIISLPDECRPDLEAIRCGAGGVNASTCVDQSQIETVRQAYADWRCSSGATCPSAHPGVDATLLYPGLSPGSEAQWDALHNGTGPSPYGLGYVRSFVYGDADWDWRGLDDDERLVRDAMRLDSSGAEAADFDIRAFRDRGGKLVLYHGDADGLVPTRGSTLYYERTREAMGEGEQLDSFFGYFRVPGMLHCVGTAMDAPWHFGAWGQATVFGTGSGPGPEDAEHDALAALVAWVEQGHSVDRIVATTWRTWNNASSGVLRQRPLCRWPKRAVWDGVGDRDEAGSWECVMVE